MAEGLQPLRFIKNWNQGTTTREQNWDELANKAAAFGVQTNNNFKQLALDIGGITYAYNGIGRATQSINVVSRITTLEAQSGIIGPRNLGLDLSTQSKIKIIGADGENLSETNKGLVAYNSTADVGQLVTREITSNLEVTLTGAHWGHDTYGDLTDYVLWLYLIDTGSDSVLAVGAQGGARTIDGAATFTTPGSVTSIGRYLVSTDTASEYNCTCIGWVKANFDDTGNAGGENYWTVQNGVGDVNIGSNQTYFEGIHVW